VVLQNYDAIGRLCAIGTSGATCTTGTNHASGFAYNPAGEVAGFNYGNGIAAAFSYSADRLQLTSLAYTKSPTTLLSLTYDYSHDCNGKMTNDGANSVTYDAENRAVTAAGTTYVYDGNGLRVRKCAPNCTSPTSSTVYIFAGSKVIAEYDNSAAPASPTREYI